MAKWLVTCHLGIYKHTRELQNPFFTWNTAFIKTRGRIINLAMRIQISHIQYLIAFTELIQACTI